MRQIILITGLIGSGKSTVSDILRQRGHEVLNMDKIAKAVIHNEFSEDFYAAFGKEQFPKEVYFKPEYKEARKAFEYKLDAYLSDRIMYLIHNLHPDYKKPLFIEVPAMNHNRFEHFIAPFRNAIKYALLVSVNSETRCARLIERGLTYQQIVERTELQSEDIPVTIVHRIDNNATVELLEKRLIAMDF